MPTTAAPARRIGYAARERGLEREVASSSQQFRVVTTTGFKTDVRLGFNPASAGLKASPQVLKPLPLTAMRILPHLALSLLFSCSVFAQAPGKVQVGVC